MQIVEKLRKGRTAILTPPPYIPRLVTFALIPPSMLSKLLAPQHLPLSMLNERLIRDSARFKLEKVLIIKTFSSLCLFDFFLKIFIREQKSRTMTLNLIALHNESNLHPHPLFSVTVCSKSSAYPSFPYHCILFA